MRDSLPPYQYHNTSKVSANEGCFADRKSDGIAVYLKTFFHKKKKGKPLKSNFGSGVAEVLASHLRIFADEEFFDVPKGESKVIPYNFVHNNEGQLRIESKVLGGRRPSGEKGPETDSTRFFVPLWELAGFKKKPRGILQKDLYQEKVKNLMNIFTPKEKDALSEDLVTNLWFANRDPNLGNVGRYKGCLWFLDQGHSLRRTDRKIDEINKENRREVLKGKPINNLRLYGVNQYEIFSSDAAGKRAEAINRKLQNGGDKKLAEEIRRILREECLPYSGIKGIKEFGSFAGCDISDERDKNKLKKHFDGDPRSKEDNPEFWIELISMQLTRNLKRRGEQLTPELARLESLQEKKGRKRAESMSDVASQISPFHTPMFRKKSRSRIVI